MKTVDSVKSILIELISSYRMLLYVLHKERECLINLNAAGIENLSKEKDTIILRLQLFEEERGRLIAKFIADNNITGNMSLQRIYELTGDNSFQVLESQLLKVLQSIEDMNEFNRILMERSINFVKNAANFLNSFAFNTKNRGVVLSKEA
ncbi:MAG: flagellar protein FlgN [Desulfobacterales bacterium]|nr:flagellar protein FlgN [Desulfobacterales bacterium]